MDPQRVTVWIGQVGEYLDIHTRPILQKADEIIVYLIVMIPRWVLEMWQFIMGVIAFARHTFGI